MKKPDEKSGTFSFFKDFIHILIYQHFIIHFQIHLK